MLEAKKQALIAQVARLGSGAKILSSSEAIDIDLGPLADLKGTWVAKPFGGWNVIAVPGPDTASGQGFVLEVIPYEETITFTPVVVAGNRGPVVNGVQEQQHITGLIYEQIVTSVCDTELCNNMKFPAGTEIHAETGMILNLLDFNTSAGAAGTIDQFTIARLATIPHGNSVMALGTSLTDVPANNDFFPDASISPSAAVQGQALPFGYGELQYGPLQFPEFDQSNPNSFLNTTLNVQNAKINSMTTLKMSTKNGTGGLLNVPFLQQHVNATDMEATFWIERLANPIAGEADILQLQYSQTINLVFPPTGSTQLITWPHVTISTLSKEK